ncbi:MAG: hypothetical protein AB4058_19645 [Microcystaceae cyanobacterium]
MTEIICLANSWKHHERCIAGINPKTGRWIRPICPKYPDDGRVPPDIRLIDGEEPQLLDLLDIPLQKTGNNFGFESENRNIAAGKWRKIKSVSATELIPYCHDDYYILHNTEKYVTVPYLQSLPKEERQTLQLVYAELTVECKSKGGRNNRKWKGSLITEQGEQLTNITITDPEFVQKLDDGYYPTHPCLVTVSLSMPYRFSDWEGDDPCWKLIAGVIELSELDLILVEMERIGWTIDQGRHYLEQTYHKHSRRQLSDYEVQEFLTHLTSIRIRESSRIDWETIRKN